MNKIELKARAKINLSLDVLSKRPDGYHEVEMIMQTIELHDVVHIQEIDKGIEIQCGSPWVPNDSRNIAYKAASLLMDKCGLKGGVKISIRKNIPVSAGLAGGSTDAAAVLSGMNSIFNLGLGKRELMELGRKIGADVPFCIKGGTMLSRGIGEILTEIESFSNVNIVLVKPKIGVSTEWVYRNLDLTNIGDRPDTGLITELIGKGDVKGVAQNMRNVLERVTVKKHGVINEIKDRLAAAGALGSMMSGSGPTVFGIFENGEKAEKAYNMLNTGRWECILTKTQNEER